MPSDSQPEDLTPNHPSDRTELYAILRSLDLSEFQTVRLVEILENIAAANMIALLDSKLDNLQSRLEGRIDSLDSKVNSLRDSMDYGNSSTDSRFQTLQWLAVTAIGVGGLIFAFLSIMVAIGDNFSFSL